ncbi:MAG: addiction module protein [Thermoanaerobaculia bacterium]
MPHTYEEIASAALQLNINARAELAKRLLESLDDLSPAENERLWVEEAARRYQQLKNGAARSIPAEEVFAQLQARLRK